MFGSKIAQCYNRIISNWKHQMFAVKRLLILPLLGCESLSRLMTILLRIMPTSANIPELDETLKRAETPLDLLVEYINFWARITNVEPINIDRESGYIITWDELDKIWTEVFNILKENTGYPIELIQTIWWIIAQSVPDHPNSNGKN